MPRVYTQKASRRKYTAKDAERGRVPEGSSVGDPKPGYSCEWPGCSDREIKPGEEYHMWSFRYGGDHRMHASHGRPLPSMLTQSKMSTVYAAVEAFDLGGLETEDEIASALADLGNEVGEVASEYAEAAEAFGGAGENQERADELEGWASELEGWSTSASPEYCPDHEDPSDLTPTGDSEYEYEECAECEACEEKRQDYIEQMHTEARELADGCPL